MDTKLSSRPKMLYTYPENVLSISKFYILMDVVKAWTAFPPEIDCNQTATSLPPVTSAVFIAKSFW
jgi:hypothetical protein